MLAPGQTKDKLIACATSGSAVLSLQLWEADFRFSGERDRE